MTIVSRGTALLLLGSIWACTLLMSCKSSDSRSASARAEKVALSKGELIRIAAAVAPQYDIDPNEWKPSIDEDNAGWRMFILQHRYRANYENEQLVWPVVKDDELDGVIVRDFPMLRDRDYQSLWYFEVPSGPIRTWDGERVILIDRNTGEVLVVVDVHGRVVKPRSGSASRDGTPE
jgi:hypothetical protein